ncbi:2178_t:CDS:2, partial [Acaulospora morrowiae]
ITPCSISNTASSSNEMSEDIEGFVSTHEALKTIFPQASNEEITKYEKQLSSVKIFDSVLIITSNQAWINQHDLLTYYRVMDAFATNSLQNRYRDENSCYIFYFETLTELYTVCNNILALFPNTFFVSSLLQAQYSNTQLHLVEMA